MSSVAGGRPVRARVTGATVAAHVRQPVLLVGKVKQAPENQVAIVEAADGASITVHTATDSAYRMGAFVEVSGVVNEDKSVREESALSLGENFDLANYRELVQLTEKVPELFR